MLHGISKPRRLAADFINIHSVYKANGFNSPFATTHLLHSKQA